MNPAAQLQRQQDIETVGGLLDWRPLTDVPTAELDAMSSHLRDECGWGCLRVCEVVCEYRTCRRVMRHMMGLHDDRKAKAKEVAE